MGLNAKMWSTIVNSDYEPQIRLMVEALQDRLLPTLKESDISHEAEGVADHTWQELGSLPGREDVDMGDLADFAHEAGAAHYMTLRGIRHGLINMFAAGLHHIFEQQFVQFHRRELLDAFENRHPDLFTFIEGKRRLLLHGINVEDFRAWRKLSELRLVANTVKHAEGDSAKRLRECRPDLFSSPDLKAMGIDGIATNTPIFMPLVGEDLFVLEGDIDSYRDAILDFWKELIAGLERMDPPVKR
jgi:hypothetical protein